MSEGQNITYPIKLVKMQDYWRNYVFIIKQVKEDSEAWDFCKGPVFYSRGEVQEYIKQHAQMRQVAKSIGIEMRHVEGFENRFQEKFGNDQVIWNVAHDFLFGNFYDLKPFDETRFYTMTDEEIFQEFLELLNERNKQIEQRKSYVKKES